MCANRCYQGNVDYQQLGTPGVGWEFNPADWFNGFYNGHCCEPGDSQPPEAGLAAHHERFDYLIWRDGRWSFNDDGTRDIVKGPEGGVWFKCIA